LGKNAVAKEIGHKLANFEATGPFLWLSAGFFHLLDFAQMDTPFGCLFLGSFCALRSCLRPSSNDKNAAKWATQMVVQQQRQQQMQAHCVQLKHLS